MTRRDPQTEHEQQAAEASAIVEWLQGDLVNFTKRFTRRLSRVAVKFERHQRRADEYKWLITEIVLREWEENETLRAEIRKHDYYAMASETINAALPYPVCSASGETLRQWCDIAEAYRHMPARDAFRKVLKWQHFAQARRLANLPENISQGLTPDLILAEAYNNHLTAEEMRDQFDASRAEPVHEYDRAIGWLDSLQGLGFGWIKDKDKRYEINKHLAAIRQMLEGEQ